MFKNSSKSKKKPGHIYLSNKQLATIKCTTELNLKHAASTQDNLPDTTDSIHTSHLDPKTFLVVHAINQDYHILTTQRNNNCHIGHF